MTTLWENISNFTTIIIVSPLKFIVIPPLLFILSPLLLVYFMIVIYILMTMLSVI